ncbi:MAG: substrate-binding domain-containing protein, partial [Tepidisphaeraceae bacterium]
AVLRGATQYANLQRRWLLRKELRHFLEARSVNWPKFDGAIFAGVPNELLELGRAQCKHVVICSGAADPRRGPVVRLDDEAAGALAARHLIECRLPRFSFYGLLGSRVSLNRRMLGFRREVQAQGKQFVECPLNRPTEAEWLSHMHRPALLAWLKGVPKPIGILAFDDSVAHDLADACVDADIGVPEQVAIIGINNDDLLCEGAWPPLSSVDPDYSRIGYAAAAMLDRLLSGESLSLPDRLIELPPIGVVQRQSTSLLAIADPDLALAIRFIREHACDPCSVQDLLRAVPVGRRWLERNFVSQIGRTPHEEITRVRIEAAQRLLASPAISIHQVAIKCGFFDVKNFYVTFRKQTGQTPGAYRKDHIRPIS